MGKVSCGALKWFLLLISFIRSTSHWFFLLFFYFESLCLKIVCTMVLWCFFFRRNSISVTCLRWSETNKLLYLLLFFWYFFEIITCLSLCFVIVWHLTLCNNLLTKICSQFKPNFTGSILLLETDHYLFTNYHLNIHTVKKDEGFFKVLNREWSSLAIL